MLTEFTAILDYNEEQRGIHILDRKEFLRLLCEDGFTPQDLGEAVIGAASLGHPVMARPPLGGLCLRNYWRALYVSTSLGCGGYIQAIQPSGVQKASCRADNLSTVLLFAPIYP